MWSKIIAAALGAALGAATTITYEVGGGTCYCYQISDSQADWGDNCPPNYQTKHQNICPDPSDL